MYNLPGYRPTVGLTEDEPDAKSDERALRSP